LNVLRLSSRGWLLALAVLVAATVVPLAIAGSGPVLVFASPDSTFFGTVAKNSTTTHTWTYTNKGGSATSVLSVSLSGAAAFTIASNTCSAVSLGPNKSCMVGVSYTPTTDGADDHATLTVSSKKPALSVPLYLNGATAAADPYAAARTSCQGYGYTFAVGTGIVLWTCDTGGDSLGDAGFNTLADECIAEGGTGGFINQNYPSPGDLATCETFS
jgi:hypothetical protein